MGYLGLDRRIIGSETEHGFRVTARNGEDITGAVGMEAFGSLIERVWCPQTGGCNYLDSGNHPEWATPECRSGAEVAVYERIGQHKIVRGVQSVASKYRARSVILVRNNAAVSDVDRTVDVSFGAHENYMAASRLLAYTPAYTYRMLAPFVATRILWAGAGSVEPIPGGGWRYELSERSRFIHRIHHLSTMDSGLRGMFTDREDDSGQDDTCLYTQHWRLQVIAGDSNLHPDVVALKFDTMALLLRMLEADALPIVEMVDPVEALHGVSADPNFTVPLEASRTTTALKVQKIYLDAAAKFADRHDLRREKEVVARWARFYHLLEKAPPTAHLGVFDLATKYRLLKRRSERLGRELTLREARSVSERYAGLLGPADKSGKPVVMADRICAQYDPQWFRGALNRLSGEAPQTRAAARARLVGEYGMNGSDVCWSRVDDQKRGRRYLLRDPFSSATPAPVLC